MLESGSEGPFQLISVAPAEPVTTVDNAAGLFEGLASRCAELNLKPIIERVFAPPEVLPALREARREALELFGLPVTGEPSWVCNPLPSGSLLDSIQVLGVRLEHDWSWRRLEATASCSGTLVQSPELEIISLSDLCGSLGRPPKSALRDMFSASEEALRQHGFLYSDVARTWFYIADLFDWYAPFNETRDELFARTGIEQGSCPPASSCVQGLHAAGAPCHMELLALKSTASERPFRPLRPLRQCEPWQYGSTFSRGMVLDFSGQHLVTVSATASIGPQGESRHTGDAKAQILDTFASVEHLLSQEGLSLESAVWQTLYFSDQACYAAWQELEKSVSIPELNGPKLLADTPRRELLFAMEASILY